MVLRKTKSTLIQNWPIILIWLFGLFLRCYRQSVLLGFYYDQGRDAKMAADIIHGANFPAIGPTTGISGLYLGPFWYYLITPGYIFSGGNPAVASYFIAILESLTIPLIYILVRKFWRTDTAYLASILWSFSHYLIRSARWFSNPSPIPAFSLSLMLLLVVIANTKRFRLLPYVALLLGLSLQLEAASAVFFIPIIFLYSLLFLPFRRLPFVIWLKSSIFFGILLLPQLAFEVKNNFLISKNFLGFLLGRVNSDTGRSWGIPNLNFLKDRLFLYYQSLFSKLDTNITPFSQIFLVIFIIGTIYLIVRYRRHSLISLLLIWLFLPLFLLLFFQGNYGTLYDYYLTGFFPAFIILFAVIITLPTVKPLSYILTALILVYFTNGNLLPLKNYLSANPDGPEHITLGNELAAVDKVCSLNNQLIGNFDVYVPPVVAHAYEYLISWRQRQHLCRSFDSAPNQTVYLITEVDPAHPERLSGWFDKYHQDKINFQQSYGGITVYQLTRANGSFGIAQ